MNEPEKNNLGNILIIDDDETVREIHSQMLDAKGYSVATCQDGEEGVNYYKQNYNSIDLVLLDMIMPNMGGYECFKKLKEINPNVKVIISSGYNDENEVKEMIEQGAGYIQKPVKMDDLAKKVEEYINKN
jgi:DNA-binding NtrC family response regulator